MWHRNLLIHVDQSTIFLGAFLHKASSALAPKWRSLLLKASYTEYSYKLKLVFERAQNERVGMYVIRYNGKRSALGSTDDTGRSSLAQVWKAPASCNDAFESDT